MTCRHCSDHQISDELGVQMGSYGEEAYVVILPGRMGGRPTIGHRRLTTHMIADMYWSMGFQELIDMYNLTHGEIVVAVWYEARYGGRTHRKRWAEWLEVNDPKLYSPSIFGNPAPPPQKEAP